MAEAGTRAYQFITCDCCGRTVLMPSVMGKEGWQPNFDDYHNYGWRRFGKNDLCDHCNRDQNKGILIVRG
jgi:hypothetical protein